LNTVDRNWRGDSTDSHDPLRVVGSNETVDTSLKTVTFDQRKLLSLSKDGLEYVDDQGNRCAIDFHACHENFKKQHVPERLWARVPNYVAVRDIEAKPAHITFATIPPTRFVFPMRDLTFHEFQELQLRLFREAGVMTFDMT
jgi:hypothetical protein